MYNPVSTYRIQFNNEFTFRHFEEITAYLHDLGVQTIYGSPIFRAVPGSSHGYDGVHPLHINSEIGTIEQLKKISSLLSKNGMGWLQDIVPNHMAFHPDNDWLMDVLKKGRASKYASFFDTGYTDLLFDGKLMVPFLGDTLEKVIENGDLTLVKRKEDYYLSYFESFYPVSEASAQKITTKSALLGDPLLIKQIAEEQEYRLCSWKETDNTINYRRFFTVNSLICLNIHDSEVFNRVHELIRSLVLSGVFQGLRVDHIDGLYNPTGYLEQLRVLAGEDTYLTVEKILKSGEPLLENWPVQGTTGYDFLGLVNNVFTSKLAVTKLTRFYHKMSGEVFGAEESVFEKKRLILNRYMQGELFNLYRLLLNSGLLPDEQAKLVPEDALKAVIGELLVRMPWYRFYGNTFPLAEAEASAIAGILKDILRQPPPDTFDSKNSCRTAIKLIEDILIREPLKRDSNYNKRVLHYYRRCMQFSGPLMAKGVEDTLMYANSRLIVHNEVGDSPASDGMSAQEFHKAILERQEKWPLTMNGTSTHDTKRGEDVRARLNVLTNLSDEWLKCVADWQALNLPLRKDAVPDRIDEYFIYQTLVGVYPMPGEPLQDLEQRLHQYLEKACREAKRHSDWSAPNTEYEGSLRHFITGLLDPKKPFLKHFAPFHQKVSDLAISNSLSQVLLKFTCPGIPDVYQGCESWDFSLVDPDNRRPVDYSTLAQWLHEIKTDEIQHEALTKSLWRNRFNGKIKFWLTHVLLKERQANQEFFEHAVYVPLEIRGKYKDHFLAFARRYQLDWTITVVPLLPGLEPGKKQGEWWKVNWADTQVVLPPEAPTKWRNVLLKNTGTLSGAISVGTLLTELPVTYLRSLSSDNKRGAGILMAVSSLPSSYGVGDMGPEAYAFAGFLSRSQQRYWQVLPLNPTEHANGNSPYSSNSSMAGNTLLISPQLLAEKGLLSDAQLILHQTAVSDQVNYEAAEKTKRSLLDLAWENYKMQNRSQDEVYNEFCKQEAHWLDDFALYITLKKKYRQPWHEWPDAYRKRIKRALAAFAAEHTDEISQAKWEQQMFMEQWTSLRQYCHATGIQMFGDLPFYVNHDSADVWANPEIFSLDKKGQISGVAGVPPDYFNDTGQLWGMPVFRWDVLKKQDYDWWLRRIQKNMQLYDLLRLDHFRAFSSYWEVPFGENTAINGKWHPGPGAELFHTIERKLGRVPFIAEDLGDVDEPVYRLRDELQLPGMKVLQFGFGDDMATSIFAPHNFTEKFVTYTGTHDNNTTLGWLRQENPDAAKRLFRYLNTRVNEKNIHQILIRLAFASVAQTAIIPLQDLLGLDEMSRMNTPATSGGNWGWRMQPGTLTVQHEKFLRELTQIFNRV